MTAYIRAMKTLISVARPITDRACVRTLHRNKLHEANRRHSQQTTDGARSCAARCNSSLDTVKSIAAFLALIAVTFLCGGCTRTYLSTGDPGVPSPNGTTRLCLTRHGAYGRSYIDKTGKLVDVDIRRGFGTNETTLFSHRYKFVGSDLDAGIRWNSSDEVVIILYDYGPGVSSYDAPKTGVASNYIATLAFQKDKATDKFVEKK
jgi:hypothetical protein